jgi:hypothetical protein
MRLLSSFFSGNRGVKFLNGGCVGEPDAIANVIRYAKFRSRSHDVVVRVCDDAGNVIEMHEHAGEFERTVELLRFLAVQ